MKKKTAKKILKETEQGYDLIAEKFSETRKYFWRGLEFISDYIKAGDKVLDFGCGNGRLLDLFLGKDINYTGIDVSEKLINIAKAKYPEKADNFRKISSSDSLPLPDNSFNTVFSIAVFHHFPSKKYREDMAKELYRITKKDGRIVITVWNLWQKKYIKNIIDNWLNKIYFIFSKSISLTGGGNPSQLDWNDCYISFTDNSVHSVKSAKSGAKQFNKARKFQRYHHAFTRRELRNLFKKNGFKIEKCEIVDGRNIIFIGKK